MNREMSANFCCMFGWIFASVNPSIIPQGLAMISSVLAIINYWYSIREKRKLAVKDTTKETDAK